MKKDCLFLMGYGVMLLSVAFVHGTAYAQQGGPVWYASPGGNDDTGDGSEGSPWSTIVKAVTRAAEGDTLPFFGSILK